MILADSSAWIEYLRKTESDVNVRMRELVAGGSELAVTDVVLMEVLAGAQPDDARTKLHRLLGGFEYLPTLAPGDYEAAADLSRACRRAGEAVRRRPACLIAAVAIRTGAAVLHRDADFAVLARHTALALA